MSTVAAASAAGSATSPGEAKAIVSSSVTAVMPKAGSTRCIATIKVTKPQEDCSSQFEATRSMSCRVRGSANSNSSACAREPLVSTTPGVQVSSADEKDQIMSSPSNRTSVWKSALKSSTKTSKDNPAGSQPTSSVSTSSGQPRAMLNSVGPSAYELSQRKTDGKEQWKVLKNKLTALRKKSSSSEAPSEVVANVQEAAAAGASLVVPRLERSARGSTTSITSTTSSLKAPGGRSVRSNSQDEGIICKREDLIHLLSEVAAGKSSLTKKNSVGSPEPSSPTPSLSASASGRRTSLKNQTPQFSTSLSDREDNSHNSHNSNSSSSSKRTSICRTASFAEEQGASLDIAEAPKSPTIVIQTSTESETASGAAESAEVFLEETKRGPEAEPTEAELDEAKVQWDEANTVDAMMLGDAIEAFLKNISEPPPPPVVVEKRVSFKKC